MEQHYSEIMPPILLNLNVFSPDDANNGTSAFEACLTALWKINDGLKDTIIPLYTEFIDSRL